MEVTAQHWMQLWCFKPEREYVWACTWGGVVHGAGQQEVEVLLVSSLLLEPRLQHHLHGEHVVLHLLQVDLGSQHQTVCWRHRERQTVSQASKLTGNVLHFSVRQRRENRKSACCCLIMTTRWRQNSIYIYICSVFYWLSETLVLALCRPWKLFELFSHLKARASRD